MSSPSADAGTSTTVRRLLAKTGLQTFIDAGTFNEISVNRPGEIFTKSAETWARHDAPGCTLEALHQLANALTVFKGPGQAIGADNPMVPVELPDGQRGQILVPPACERDTVCLTIRVPGSHRYSVDDFLNTGRLSEWEDVSDHTECPADVKLRSWELEALEAKRARDVRRFLQLGITHRLNFALVGSTGSGKTAFTKALVDLIPSNERLATIEDTHELSLPNHPNRGHFFYGAHASAKSVVSSMMRWNPDRIFLTELRGDEAWDYLTLLKSGHPGGVTSVHANDARSAFPRVAALVKQSLVGQTLDLGHILREVMLTIDVVMYFKDTHLRELYYDPITKHRLQRGER